MHYNSIYAMAAYLSHDQPSDLVLTFVISTSELTVNYSPVHTREMLVVEEPDTSM